MAPIAALTVTRFVSTPTALRQHAGLGAANASANRTVLKLQTPNGVAPSELQTGKVLRTDGERGNGISVATAGARAAAFPRLGAARQPASTAGAPGSKAAAGGRGVSLVWFRADLRTHDHEPLAAAAAESTSLVPVFIFDPRDFGKTAAGFDKTGPHRAQFVRECVSDLRTRLRDAGSELVVRIGQPEQVLARLVRDTGAGAVYTHQEATAEEAALEKAVAAAVREAGDAELKLFWGSTLHHVDDLPFQLPAMPTTYGGFRERMHGVKIRPSVSTPKRLKGLPAGCNVEVGHVPTLEELGVSSAAAQGRDGGHEPNGDAGSAAGKLLRGGETEALARLGAFVAQTRARLRQSTSGGTSTGHGKPRAGLDAGAASAHFSTQVSPWLAMGCLSPRRMYEELRAQAHAQTHALPRIGAAPYAAHCHRAPAHVGSNGQAATDVGTNWLVFELLWRDFFRFVTKKYAAQASSSLPVAVA